MSKQHKYPLNKVRRNYTYTVEQIADIFGISRHTVFRWIKDENLQRVGKTKKFLVHGSQLYRFLNHKRRKKKKPCKAGEMFCFKCQGPRKPKTESIEIQKIPNKTVRVFGKCAVCNTRMNIVVGVKNWAKKHPFHPNNNAPKKNPSGEHESQHKCQHRVGEQTCLNLTPPMK